MTSRLFKGPPDFFARMQLLLRKNILSGLPRDLPTFRVTRRGWEASVPQKIIMYSLPATVATTIASRQACQTICGLPAVIAVMRDYKLPIYSCARRFVRSTLNLWRIIASQTRFRTPSSRGGTGGFNVTFIMCCAQNAARGSSYAACSHA